MYTGRRLTCSRINFEWLVREEKPTDFNAEHCEPYGGHYMVDPIDESAVQQLKEFMQMYRFSPWQFCVNNSHELQTLVHYD